MVSRGLCLLMALYVLPETLKPADVKPFDCHNRKEVLTVMNRFGQMKILNRMPIFQRLAGKRPCRDLVGATLTGHTRCVQLYSVP